MFIREFKVRSNNQIKSSDKKNLIKEILKTYPSLKEDDLKNLIRVKDSEISLSKITTHENVDCVLYIIDKITYFFKIDKEEQILPTVYFLWKFPDILYKFYTHNEVFGKLLNGADLMLPGIITSGPVNLYTFKQIKKNDLCVLCLSGNNAPVALCRTYLCGEDMYMSAMKGRGLKILHIYQDNLWALGDRTIPVPNIPIPEPILETKTEISEESEAKHDENLETSNQVEEKFDELKLDRENSNETEVEQEEQEESEDVLDHEKILTDSFLCAIKFKSKEFKLPVIVSTFVKTLQSCCPPNAQYDIKKTRFKKINVFLKEMESKGCIKTKELQKGVLSITEISKENDLVKYFKKPEWMKEAAAAGQETDRKDEKFIYEIVEMFKIDGNTEEFFKPTFRKGDVVNSGEVRNYCMNYIKEKNLQLKDEPKYLQPNDLIYKIFVKNKQVDKMKFDELFAIVFGKLTPMHEIRKVSRERREVCGEAVLQKGKFQPIEFKLESRGGNKKVTSVHYLSAFGVDFTNLQAEIRRKIGCSVSLVEPGEAASNTETIICLQGNQIIPISEFLNTEVGIQLKHMKGLELGVKTPK